MNITGLLLQVRSFFDGAGYGPLSTLAATLLGAVSAIASACCTLPLIGILASSTIVVREERQSALRNSFLFLAGAVITILCLGGSVVFAGKALQQVSGIYWKIIAGFVAIIFGIVALELFPFSLPKLNLVKSRQSTMSLWPWVSGIVFGGSVAVSSLPCNPGVFIILGAAVLQKHTYWALLNLTAYALGFSAPLAALVLGLSFGKRVAKFQKIEKVIRTGAGIFLIAAGIYLFYSL